MPLLGLIFGVCFVFKRLEKSKMDDVQQVYCCWILRPVLWYKDGGGSGIGVSDTDNLAFELVCFSGS